MENTYRSFSFSAALSGALCIVFTGPARAQDLSSSELLAPVGWSSLHLSIADFIPWDTLVGSGVTWSYGWVEVDSATDVEYRVIDLVDAPSAGGYPAADRVVRSIAGPADDYITDRFYDLTPDRVLELGSVGPVLSYAYDAPGILYGLPMTLGDTMGSDYCYWSDGLGVQYHFCGNTLVTFDAMGTLELPYGTYAGAKHVTLRSSSFETTVGSADSSYIVKQQWFLPGIPAPVLEANVYIADDGTWYPSGWLMSQGSLTGMLERANAVPDWSVHPNPTEGLITLKRTSAGAAVVDVLTNDGRCVRTFNLPAGTPGITVDLEGLPAGIYLVRMSGSDGTATRRVVKTGGR